MKVTIFSNSKGGVFTYTLNIIEGLCRKGCYPKVFFLEYSEEATQTAYPPHVRPRFLLNAKSIPNIQAWMDLLIRDRPDILHVNFVTFGILALIKKILLKTPFFLMLHGFSQPHIIPSYKEKLFYTIDGMFLPIVASFADKIGAVSTYVKNVIQKRYGIIPEVIPNFINVKNFSPLDKSACKRHLGYAETDMIVLYVGNLIPYKDPLTLIKGFAKAAEKRTLFLIVIGTGLLQKTIQKTINQLNIATSIRLMGYVNNNILQVCYNASDVFVLPSVNESFGITLLEAMAYGIPIIGSNTGGIPEVIGDAGILFQQGDPDSLAAKLLQLTQDQDLRHQLSVRGYKRVSGFSQETVFRRYWKLYQTFSRRNHSSCGKQTLNQGEKAK